MCMGEIKTVTSENDGKESASFRFHYYSFMRLKWKRTRSRLKQTAEVCMEEVVPFERDEASEDCDGD